MGFFIVLIYLPFMYVLIEVIFVIICICMYMIIYVCMGMHACIMANALAYQYS